ncbi:MAG: type II toxin-antitoxin system VapC family toxin [Anaerolineae bacterium]|nr:type II toxin-antitoxin system VapC family toxin [Anaerolineae bacterium]
MLVFVLDACALARVYFKDIGISNMLYIYNYPDSRLVIPSIAYPEVVSTLVSTLKGHSITAAHFHEARKLLSRDLSARKALSIEVTAELAATAAGLLEKHKTQPGRGKLSGADAVYLALAVDLAKNLAGSDDRVILVTSDGPLYQAALDEPNVEAFHFWTCDLGCKCGIVWIPIKGSPQPPKPSNICPTCGRTCDPCSVSTCPSMFKVSF